MLDFTDPEHSEHYNFFRYIRNTQDIVKIAHMLIYQEKHGGHSDPFWDQASQLLVQGLHGIFDGKTGKRRTESEMCYETDQCMRCWGRL